jgi:hypothetical protein
MPVLMVVALLRRRQVGSLQPQATLDTTELSDQVIPMLILVNAMHARRHHKSTTPTGQRRIHTGPQGAY